MKLNLPKYNNKSLEFDDYWAKIESDINQTVLGPFLDQPPDPGDSNEKNLDVRLFYTLTKCLLETDAEHLVWDSKKRNGESGQHLANALRMYYLTERCSDLRHHIVKKIKSLDLKQGGSIIYNTVIHQRIEGALLSTGIGV